jgi:acetylornithine deacetylase/succinyl-diaminopimelate desuccinylase-like protein
MSDRIADRVRRFLQAERHRQEAFLAELVRLPSDNPPGDCAPAAERTAALLEALDFAVERHPVQGSLVRGAGMVSVTNLIVRHRFNDGHGLTLALNAHGDAVPPGAGWTRDPYGAQVVGGWMHGRGVAVSKSDIATYIWALLALRAAAAASIAGTVELHLTYDEESGGEIGPALLLREGVTRPDLAIGAGFSYAVVTAHNGCLHLEVQVEGKSAHAAMPSTGVDALEVATAILSALYRWRGQLSRRVSSFDGIGSPQLTVGLIEGGINTNVVPDRVTFRLDRRIVPEEDAADVEGELRSVIAQAALAFPAARVSIRRILLARPLVPLPDGQKLTESLCRRATEIIGEPVTSKGVPLYTDARHYAAHGIPTVLYGAGPRTIEEANAHRADERLLLSDLHKATEVIALTLADMLRIAE